MKSRRCTKNACIYLSSNFDAFSQLSVIGGITGLQLLSKETCGQNKVNHKHTSDLWKNEHNKNR